MHNIIVGSGPAAAGVALALCHDPGQEVTVVDLGGVLEPDAQQLVEHLGSQPRDQWSPAELATITRQPAKVSSRSLPQKRAYGSDYPFRDRGQLAHIVADNGANRSVVSGAYGGFSNIWGAQIMPFSRSTFTGWPVAWSEMQPHYSAILDEVPLAAEPDDLETVFPLFGKAQPLPMLAPRSSAVLANYAQHRGKINGAGMTLGRARLAFNAGSCVRCGLCMTGCPYGLIYSARQTFDRLRSQGRIRYVDRMLAVKVAESAEQAVLTVRNERTDAYETMAASRIFVACGGFGSTRLALASMPRFPSSFEMAESVQFAIPFLSRRPTADPREVSDQFTLNQFNMLVEFDASAYSTSQIHCYPHNPAVENALPSVLRLPGLAGLRDALLSRLTIGLGYLPSWASPPIKVRVGRAAPDLPALEIDGNMGPEPLMLHAVKKRLQETARWTDLYPIVPAIVRSGPAKSYHFGGSFPHAPRGARVRGILPSDRLGRVNDWQRIHLVDGAVLPSVPSTTFTFTVMANAHRIASEVIGGPHATSAESSFAE